jgi:hypothetical protein
LIYGKFLLALGASLGLMACSKDAAVSNAAGAGGGGFAVGGAAGGASGTAGVSSGGVLVVPEALEIAPRPQGNGVLDVVAATLQKGPEGADLYLAVQNVGTTPACSPAFSVELFDEADQSLSAGVGGLLARRFYRVTESGAVAGCVGPGDVGMIAMTALPLDVPIEDVDRVMYFCNYWVLDVTEIEGVSITDVRAVTRDGGVAYTGTLVNALDVPVSSPSVAIFPVAVGGRPLGVATSRGATPVPPGGRWDFETNTVSEPGIDFAAYSAGGL